MTITPSYIPQDVINHIVDELDDKDTLSKCSRAAHIFCEPCQRHLYARIDIDNNAEDGNRKLEETLTEYPHIQFYIRHVRLRLITRYGRVLDEGALPEILHMLPRVRSFSLSHGITTGLLHFGTLSQLLKASIFDLLQYGQLTRVELSHLQEFPIYYFSRCSQLRELNLSDVNPFHNDLYFEPNPELVPVSKPLPKTQLQSLSLEMESNPSWSFVHPQTFHHIRSSIDLSHLTSINIGHLFVNEEIDECRKILESTKFLEDLTLTLDLSHASNPPKVLSFDIPSLASVRNMSVIIHNSAHSTTPSPMRWHTLRWLHSTLRAVSHTSYIEDFKLVVGDQSVDDTARSDDLNLWNEMDLALTSSKFPYLQSVSIAFNTQRERPGDISSFLNKRMPRLFSKGLVSIAWGKPKHSARA